MATKKRSAKTLIYKRCELLQYNISLQDRLVKALESKSKAVDRREELGDSRTELVRRVISKVRQQDGMLFGQLLMYQVGKDMNFVVEDESAKDFEVESSNPGINEKGKRREILESALYFGILQNHAVLLQSRGLKSRELENHFNWLLRECTELLPADYSVCLSDKPTEKALEVIKNLPVKSVRTGSPLVAEKQDIAKRVKQNQQAVQQKTRFIPTGNGFAALKAFLGENWPKKLRLEDALDEANLEVMLQVRYKKKTTTSAHKVLDELTRAFRHMEPEDTVVDTVNGPTLRGSDLKLTGKVSVDTYNGIVDLEDLYKVMHGWLKERITEGSVL